MAKFISSRLERGTAGSAVPSGIRPALAGDDIWIPSVCKMCVNACGVRIHRVNGVVVKIEG
ncbi:MAG: hypothetical protein HYY81_12630, partial [Deltaproteobacteria bacterium]|nr:hypothetical protein [Deltaproteobacteria bacterium]